MGGVGLYIASLFFFFSSSLVTRLYYTHKKNRGTAEPEEGRSLSQVLGAGLISALFSALYGMFPAYREKTLPAALAVLTASNADTWAAELGSFYHNPPRLITRPWVKVEPGTSGGVTPLGSLGGLLGSILLGLLVFGETQVGLLTLRMSCIPLIVMLGWLGEIIDSIVGATLQIKYYCPRCKVLTDKPVHRCGEATIHEGGLRIISNEATNLIATGFVGLLALLLAC